MFYLAPFVMHLADVAVGKNSQPGLNLPITISRCQLKCMQTAEILREEHKPETRPWSIKLLLAFQRPHLSVTPVYKHL